MLTFWLLLGNEICWWIARHFWLDVPLTGNLPLHLCDLATITALIALRSNHRLSASLTYYLGVPAGIVAMLFPAISEAGAIKLIAYARFYLTHGLIVLCGLYFMRQGQIYSRWLGVLRSYAAALLFACGVALINTKLGTNYCFTQAVPSSAPQFFHELTYSMYLTIYAGIYAILFAIMRGVKILR